MRLPPSPVGLELVVVAAVAASCAARSAPPEAPPAPEPSAQPSPEPQAPAPMADALAGPWGIVEPRFTSFRLPLPDAAAWRVGDEPPGRWLALHHPGSRSELRLRTWRAARTADPRSCERQARLWRPQIPSPDAAAVLDEGHISAPAGFHTRVISSVEAVESGLKGAVLAFGASPGRCFALVFETRASGKLAAAAVGERVAQIRERSLPRVELRAIDDRAAD